VLNTGRNSASGPLRGTAGRGFFEFFVIDPPHRKPLLGVAAIIVSDGERGNNPRIISEYYGFHK
jgi:hypothetical protein